MNLSLRLQIDHQENMGTGIYHFCLGCHSDSTQKILKACVDQHHAIVVRGRYPILSDTLNVKDPNEMSLPDILAMAQSTHAHLWVLLHNLLGRDHPSSHRVVTFVQALTEQEMGMED